MIGMNLEAPKKPKVDAISPEKLNNPFSYVSFIEQHQKVYIPPPNLIIPQETQEEYDTWFSKF
jgi:hypothetical protein